MTALVPVARLRNRQSRNPVGSCNPPDVLATNFGKPATLFEKFPRKDVFIASKDGPEKSGPKRD